MNKKGDERKLIFLTAILVLSALIVFILFRFVGNALDNTSYWKDFYSRDIGLLLDIGLTGKAEMEIYYDITKAAKPLIFKLEESKVKVFDYDSERDTIPTSFRFAGDSKIVVRPKNILSSYFNILIDETSLTATESVLEYEICSNIDTKKDGVIKIFLIESEEPNIGLKEGLEREEISITEDSNSENIALGLAVENDETIVGLEFYHHGSNERKTEKMKCLVSNKLVSKNPDEFRTSIFNKINPEYESKTKLEMAEIGLLLKLNLEKMKNKDLREKISEPIIEGVKEYYGRSR